MANGYEQEAYGGTRGKTWKFGDVGGTKKKFDWGGLGTTAIGLGQSMYADKLAGQNVAANQQMWKDQIAAAQGGNITGGDVESYFDPVTKTYKQKFSDRREGMLTGIYNQVEGYNNQLGSMNPYEYADYMYEQASGARNLAQDREKAQILEMMNARGIDTSTTGNTLFGSTVQSQNIANTLERAGYITQGQDMRNAIAANQSAAIANIYGQDAVSSQQIQDAINMGVNVAPPESLSTAFTNKMDTKAKKGSALGDILGFGANMLFPGSGGLVKGLFS